MYIIIVTTTGIRMFAECRKHPAKLLEPPTLENGGDVAAGAKVRPAAPTPFDVPAHGSCGAGDGDIEKKLLAALAPENGGRRDVAAGAKPHHAPPIANGGGDSLVPDHIRK